MNMVVKGTVVSINVSAKRGERKTPVKSIYITEKGLEGDAHAGNFHRQVSLLSEESIDKIRRKGIKIGYGDFAENLTVRGIDLSTLVVGQRIKIGRDVVLEITQIGKECHQGCAIKQQIGDCVMPREGIFAKVIVEGLVSVGDSITLLD
ncbi:MAG: MOSC domain-containing protein [Thermoplasmata archaeon]|nr:MAG: MOSC domain-containing protein [Thermoplasmata archaeon]